MTRWLRAARGSPIELATEPTEPTELTRQDVSSVPSVLSLMSDPEGPPAAPDLADLLDAAEERAAIMEFDGGLSRAEAERLALAAHGPAALDAAARNPWRPAPGVCALWDHLGAAATGEGG